MARLLAIAVAAGLVMGVHSTASATIVVTSNGPMQQIYTGAGNGTTHPGTHIREHCTLWSRSDPMQGILLFTQSAASPKSICRATTTDGGLNWTTGVDTNLANPSAASADERNPVVRDFDATGALTGFFGSLQGSPGGPYVPNGLLFTAASADEGVSWSGEAMVTFNTGAFPGQTGMNGFIEVFKTSGGNLRGYTAMNKITGSPTSATHIVESSDGGATWTDLGNILIDGKNNVIGANGPVFTFVDDDDGQTKTGWFMFGESAHRGVHFVVSTDEGLSWTLDGAYSVANSSIRSGDANFISDDLVRLFYYRNTGSTPSNRQLWYEDFSLSGMSDIQPNNLYGSAAQPPVADANGPYRICIGECCGLDGRACYDPDGGDIVSYLWHVGSLSVETSTPECVVPWCELACHGVCANGTYPVTLTVTDDEGQTAFAETTLTVVPEPLSLALLGGALAALLARRRRR